MGRAAWIRLGALICATLLAYFLCLRFLYPGYFAPAAPFHTDFYDYVGVTRNSWIQLLHYPRPLTFLLFKIIGFRDVRLSMTIGIAIALVNVILAMLYAGRVWPGDRKVSAGAAVYLVILFSHSQFYIEHRHDMPASFSLLFLLLSLLGFASWLRTRSPGGLLLAAVGAFSFGFAKESFFLSAPLLIAPLFLAFPTRRIATGVFLAFCMACEVLAFLVSRSHSSPFVDLTATATAAYHIDTSISSMYGVFAGYLRDLFSWAGLGLAAIPLVLGLRRPRELFVQIAVIAAGLATLLPLALLPNHIFPEYAWMAAPFAFMPIAFLPFDRLRSKTSGSLGLLLILFLCLYEFRAHQTERGLVFRWYLRQEAIGRNLYASLAAFDHDLTDRRIAVAGLDTPFLPWLSDSYTAWRFGSRRWWFVVTPQDESTKNFSQVRFWTAPRADLRQVDALVLYRPDGRIARVLRGPAIADTIRSPLDLVPELAGIPSPAEAARPEALLDTGRRLTQWSFFDLAIPYFQRAVSLGGTGTADAAALLADASTKAAAKPPATEKPELKIDPPAARGDRNGLAAVTINWRAPAGTAVELHIGKSDGPLFAGGNGSGTARTQQWVRDGMIFYLQDVTAGKPLSPENTLATAVARVQMR